MSSDIGGNKKAAAYATAQAQTPKHDGVRRPEDPLYHETDKHLCLVSHLPFRG